MSQTQRDITDTTYTVTWRHRQCYHSRTVTAVDMDDALLAAIAEQHGADHGLRWLSYPDRAVLCATSPARGGSPRGTELLGQIDCIDVTDHLITGD